jgi:hypothetical protein
MSNTLDSSTLDVARVDYNDAPNDVVDKVNTTLALYGLQLRDDDKDHEGFILYSLVDSSTSVDNEAGPLADQSRAKIAGRIAEKSRHR